MANLGYHQYISSDKWGNKRKEVFKAYKNGSGRCEICRSKENIHIHHLTYENFTKESVDDLAVLCRECHLSLVHAAQHEEKQVFNYWIRLLRDSKSVNGRRVLPTGMIFQVPFKKDKNGKDERYLKYHFGKKRFYLIRGKTYQINEFGMPVTK